MTELYKKGTPVEDIAELMNTSSRMILSVYLSHTDQSLINLAKVDIKKLKKIYTTEIGSVSILR